MEITVIDCDWGGALPSNIEALLKDVACHFTGVFREPPEGNIVVATTLRPDDDPTTFFRSSIEDPFTILLSARGRHWSQFAYQFSHELCHVLSDYERLRNTRNNWFHEALCELASVFTTRRMVDTWPMRPPYTNWADYAQSLSSYVEEYLAREERRLPAGMTLSKWLQSEEGVLRGNCRQRRQECGSRLLSLADFREVSQRCGTPYADCPIPQQCSENTCSNGTHRSSLLTNRL